MAVVNFNPVFFLSPLIPVVFSFALLFYWRAKRVFRWHVLGFALVAYAVAILLKVVIQTITLSWMLSRFGTPSVAIALYFGLQTSFLEVGLAYAVAWFAVSRKSMGMKDAEAYGISLSFWENGVLLGLLSLVSLLSDYLIIVYAPGIGSAVSSALMTSQPSLFGPTNSSTLFTIGLGGLERVTSLLAHLSWGILTVLAAVRKKPAYFAIALPMGVIDALVPYAHAIGLAVFELIIFVLSILFLAVALWALKREKSSAQKTSHDSPAA